MNDKKSYINNNKQKHISWPQLVFFQGKIREFAFLGTPKGGSGEKNKEPERKKTVTTSKRKGHNKKQQINENHRKKKIIRVG